MPLEGLLAALRLGEVGHVLLIVEVPASNEADRPDLALPHQRLPVVGYPLGSAAYALQHGFWVLGLRDRPNDFGRLGPLVGVVAHRDAVVPMQEQIKAPGVIIEGGPVQEFEAREAAPSRP